MALALMVALLKAMTFNSNHYLTFKVRLLSLHLYLYTCFHSWYIEYLYTLKFGAIYMILQWPKRIRNLFSNLLYVIWLSARIISCMFLIAFMNIIRYKIRATNCISNCVYSWLLCFHVIDKCSPDCYYIFSFFSYCCYILVV